MQIIQIGYDIVVECGMKAALITNIFCEQRVLIKYYKDKKGNQQ